jgi:hypothetical protein
VLPTLITTTSTDVDIDIVNFSYFRNLALFSNHIGNYHPDDSRAALHTKV